MTDSNKFLKDRLKDISSKIEEIELWYEFNSKRLVHTIKVTPISFYEDCKDYIDLEEELEIDFIKLFPNEEIIFITSDSLIDISNPLYVYKGGEELEPLFIEIKKVLDEAIDTYTEQIVHTQHEPEEVRRAFRSEEFGIFKIENDNEEPDPLPLAA